MAAKRGMGWLWLLGLVALGAVFFNLIPGFYTDWLWFRSLGFDQVFWRSYSTVILLGLATGSIIFLFIYTNLSLVRRWLARQGQPENPDVVQGQFGQLRIPFAPMGRQLLQSRFVGLILFLASLLMGILGGANLSGAWLLVERFRNQTAFNLADPIFGKDVSYYVFTLPVKMLAYETAMPLLIMTLLACGFLYLANFAFSANQKAAYPLRHLATLGALAFALKSYGYHLQIDQLVFSPRGAAYGASYTDMAASRPVFVILSYLALFCAVVILTTWARPRKRLIVIAPAILMVFSLIAGVGYPTAVQAFSVEPNEFAKERPYLEHNIRFTRLAYGLDRLEEKTFPVKDTLTAADLVANQETINNIPLLDYRPVQQTYSQLQGMRLYYRFADVDVDRYMIDGKYRQVLMAVRELATDSLQAEANTWVNRHLKYTHGYGAVLSPVSKVSPEGLPELLLRDIPPISGAKELQLTRPEIYFGELTKDYVITGTKTKEFDFPQGDANAETIYKGKDGVLLSNFFNRIMFSLRLGTSKLLLTTDLTAESKVLYNRQIVDRARRLAPFLTFDKDPYPVLVDGKIVWIIDAYTTSSGFPYAQPYNGSGTNYIRNSVKTVIDAYEGTTTFYVSDATDPLIQTYQKIFPTLFTPLDQMPTELRKHLRYPEDMFTIQSKMMLNYHMGDPGVFYNKEDAWEFARQTDPDKKVVPTEPYYATMKLPDSKTEEFMAMLPLTPAKKDNMVAYLAGRSDGEGYGRLLLYKFPKDRLVFGPMQIDARISQETEISKSLTLWDQGGSIVQRGHMITVPIKESLLYVLPLYIRSQANSLPELKRVIVAYENRLAMEETLEQALAKVFGIAQPTQPGTTTPGTTTPTPPALPGTVNEVIGQVVKQYNTVKEQLQKGNWTEYGKAMEQLEKLLKQLEDQSKTSPQPTVNNPQ